MRGSRAPRGVTNRARQIDGVGYTGAPAGSIAPWTGSGASTPAIGQYPTIPIPIDDNDDGSSKMDPVKAGSATGRKATRDSTKARFQGLKILANFAAWFMDLATGTRTFKAIVVDGVGGATVAGAAGVVKANTFVANNQVFRSKWQLAGAGSMAIDSVFAGSWRATAGGQYVGFPADIKYDPSKPAILGQVNVRVKPGDVGLIAVSVWQRSNLSPPTAGDVGFTQIGATAHSDGTINTQTISITMPADTEINDAEDIFVKVVSAQSSDVVYGAQFIWQEYQV